MRFPRRAPGKPSAGLRRCSVSGQSWEKATRLAQSREVTEGTCTLQAAYYQGFGNGRAARAGCAPARKSICWKFPAKGDPMYKNTLAFLLLAACAWGQNKLTPEKEAAIKADLMGEIDHMKRQASKSNADTPAFPRRGSRPGGAASR